MVALDRYAIKSEFPKCKVHGTQNNNDYKAKALCITCLLLLITLLQMAVNRMVLISQFL